MQNLVAVLRFGVDGPAMRRVDPLGDDVLIEVILRKGNPDIHTGSARRDVVNLGLVDEVERPHILPGDGRRLRTRHDRPREPADDPDRNTRTHPSHVRHLTRNVLPTYDRTAATV